eukprot:scaffold12304_cov121-Isochrysis_galbana.AAC.2
MRLITLWESVPRWRTKRGPGEYAAMTGRPRLRNRSAHVDLSLMDSSERKPAPLSGPRSSRSVGIPSGGGGDLGTPAPPAPCVRNEL